MAACYHMRTSPQSGVATQDAWHALDGISLPEVGIAKITFQQIGKNIRSRPPHEREATPYPKGVYPVKNK